MDANQVKNLYTKKASFYHRFFIDFMGLGKKLERFFSGSDYLRPDFKVLDAGCGTGIVTRVLYGVAREKGYKKIRFDAFDFTLAMLDVFRQWIVAEDAKGVRLEQADVLNLKKLPKDWQQYDLIVSEGMLEYLPKDKLPQALRNLKRLLKDDGKLLLLMTRRNIVTRLLIQKWWKANTFEEQEVKQILESVGFKALEFKDFSKMWLNSTITVEVKK